MSDSKVLTFYLSYLIERGLDITQGVRKVIEMNYVKSALNTGIIRTFPSGRATVVSTSHIVEREPHKMCYYRLFHAKYEDIDIFMSSTLVYYMNYVDISDCMKRFVINPVPTMQFIYARRID